MVIDRNMAIGERSGFENKCCVCVSCVGRVSLPRDKCPWHRQMKMSLEFWEDVQAKDSSDWKSSLWNPWELISLSEAERSCRELRIRPLRSLLYYGLVTMEGSNTKGAEGKKAKTVWVGLLIYCFVIAS